MMLYTPCPEKGATLFSTTTLAFFNQFLQRSRIACNAERCISHGNSVRPSVHPSVRPSVHLSHADIVPRQMKMGSHHHHHHGEDGSRPQGPLYPRNKNNITHYLYIYY